MLVVSTVAAGENNRSESPPTAPAFYYGMTSDGQLTGTGTTGGSSSSVIDTPVRQVRTYSSGVTLYRDVV